MAEPAANGHVVAPSSAELSELLSKLPQRSASQQLLFAHLAKLFAAMQNAPLEDRLRYWQGVDITGIGELEEMALPEPVTTYDDSLYSAVYLLNEIGLGHLIPWLHQLEEARRAPAPVKVEKKPKFRV